MWLVTMCFDMRKYNYFNVLFKFPCFSVFAEFINGNSNAFDKPFFTQEPEDYYYIVKKNKPITVTCEAVRADEILIKCSDVYVTDITRTEVHVDRLTKVKTITASVDVTKDDLEEYFGSDTYWCECDAIANVHGSKSQLKTVSKRGLVQAACKYIFIYIMS